MTHARDPAECRVLLHDEPEPYLEELRARFPAVRMQPCTEAAQMDTALGALRPQVVFSYKCAGLPAWTHTADTVADWTSRFAAFFGDNLERWLAGKPLLKVVDPQRGY